MAPVRSSLSFERNAVLHEMLPVGFELQKLPEPLQFAWLRSAAVARYEDRGAMCTFFFFFFSLRALRNVSMPAVVKFTSRIALFAIVGLRNNTQKRDFAVFFFFFFRTCVQHDVNASVLDDLMYRSVEV